MLLAQAGPGALQGCNAGALTLRLQTQAPPTPSHPPQGGCGQRSAARGGVYHHKGALAVVLPALGRSMETRGGDTPISRVFPWSQAGCHRHAGAPAFGRARLPSPDPRRPGPALPVKPPLPQLLGASDPCVFVHCVLPTGLDLQLGLRQGLGVHQVRCWGACGGPASAREGCPWGCDLPAEGKTRRAGGVPASTPAGSSPPAEARTRFPACTRSLPALSRAGEGHCQLRCCRRLCRGLCPWAQPRFAGRASRSWGPPMPTWCCCMRPGMRGREPTPGAHWRKP